MSMTAVQVCDEVMSMSGFYPTGAYQASNDQDEKLIFALLRRAARDIAKYRWQQLVKTGTLSIVGGTTSYALPDDFREFIPRSIKTMNDSRPLDFPASFDEWSRIETQVGPTGIQHRLRLQDNKLTTLTADSASYDIRFDYISNHPVAAAGGGGVTQPTFELDNDIWLLDDDLLIKGLKVKWAIEKRLDTLTADLNDYTTYQNELKGTQAGAQPISFGTGRAYRPSAPYTNLWK